MALKYAYFPGCVAKGSAREVEDAMREVIDHLGIVLVDMPGATCCGAGVMKQANHSSNSPSTPGPSPWRSKWIRC